MPTSSVTPRPTTGSAYPTRAASAQSAQNQNGSGYEWNKNDMPGGRKLWFRLVAAFIGISVLGAFFVILGGVFFRSAMNHDIFGFIWCIIGIVTGSIMVCGSIVLGRLVISNKWRYNQQPNYPSMAIPTARLVPTVSESQEWEVQLEMQLPPPYQETAPPTDSTELAVPPPSYSAFPEGPNTPAHMSADALPPSYEEAARDEGVINAALQADDDASTPAVAPTDSAPHSGLQTPPT